MKYKKVIAALIASATIGGGVLLHKPEPLSWDEYNVLLSVYNYEIERAGGSVELHDVTDENFMDLLNGMILAREVNEQSVKIGDAEISKDDYALLRSKLIEKYERKSLGKKLYGKIVSVEN